jgi:P-type E1-E2 ATPase
MAAVYQDDKGSIYVFVKGAPDFLIPYCSKFVDRNGRQAKVTSEFNDTLNNTITDFANECLRTLLLSYKEVSSVPEEWDDIERDLCILGLVGIKDPLRDGIADAVKACHVAGVRVRMVTGDNKRTAIAIAKEAGILDKNWRE